MAEEVINPKPRNTVSLTHRQLGVGGISLIASLYLIEPLRDFVRNETKPQADQIIELQKAQANFEVRFLAAISTVERRLSTDIKGTGDRVITEITNVESRVNSSNERQDRERLEDRRELADLRNLFLNRKLKTTN
jgi:hypothetical protein